MTGLFGSWFKGRTSDTDTKRDPESQDQDYSQQKKEKAPMDYHSLQTRGMAAGTAKMLYVQRVFGDDSVMMVYTGLEYADFEDIFAMSMRHQLWPQTAAALEDIVVPHIARRKGTVGVGGIILAKYTYERCDDPRTLTDALLINPRHIVFLAMVRHHCGFSTDYIHDEYTPLGNDVLSRCIRLISPILADILPTPIKITRAIKDAKDFDWLPGGTDDTKTVLLDGSHVRICKPGILLCPEWPGEYEAIPTKTRMLLNRDNVVLAMSDTLTATGDNTAKPLPPLPDLGAVANKKLVNCARPVNSAERSTMLEMLDFLGTEGNEHDVGLMFIDKLAGTDDQTWYMYDEKRRKAQNQKTETIDDIDPYSERIVHSIPIYEGTPGELNYDLEIACGIMNLSIMLETDTYQDWQSILR